MPSTFVPKNPVFDLTSALEIISTHTSTTSSAGQSASIPAYASTTASGSDPFGSGSGSHSGSSLSVPHLATNPSSRTGSNANLSFSTEGSNQSSVSHVILPLFPRPSRYSFVPQKADSRRFVLQSEAACAIMAAHMLDIAVRRRWVINEPEMNNAVAIRVGRGRYVLSSEEPRLATFERAMQSLGPEVAFTFTSSVIQGITETFGSRTRQVALSPTVKVQVVDRMEDLRHNAVRFAQKAAFIRTEGTLVIWFNKVEEFESTVLGWEDMLVNYVWNEASRNASAPSSIASSPSLVPSSPSLETIGEETNKIKSTEELEIINEKEEENIGAEDLKPRSSDSRGAVYYNDAYTGLAVALGTFQILSSYYLIELTLCSIADIVICVLMPRTLLREYLADGQAMRLCIMVTLPFLVRIMMHYVYRSLADHRSPRSSASFSSSPNPSSEPCESPTPFSALCSRLTYPNLF